MVVVVHVHVEWIGAVGKRHGHGFGGGAVSTVVVHHLVPEEGPWIGSIGNGPDCFDGLEDPGLDGRGSAVDGCREFEGPV